MPPSYSAEASSARWAGRQHVHVCHVHFSGLNKRIANTSTCLTACVEARVTHLLWTDTSSLHSEQLCQGFYRNLLFMEDDGPHGQGRARSSRG